MNKYDRRRKYYMILDCETATLPFIKDYPAHMQQKLSINKPLIYDIGWTIIDGMGRIYAKKNYLITEIFSVPSVFNTAYYKEKRPLYIEKLERGEIVLTDWRSATKELVEDLEAVEAVGAYNAMFDFKKAIPFTDLYIDYLYSSEFEQWMNYQKECCEYILSNGKRESKKGFEGEIFRFRGKEHNLFDLWGLSCEHLLNNDEYRKMCFDNEWKSKSGKYFTTTAETTYRFITQDLDFIESHTALDDAEIESIIFSEISKKVKKKIPMGIAFFPFRIVGRVPDYEF